MKGAVAAGHSITADTAAEVLRAGGNAFDAAIAAFFTACVCEPVLASLGGGGFLLARDSTGRTKVFDFFTHTPLKQQAEIDVHFYPVTVDFGSAQQEFHIGLGSCATPGVVRGLSTVHKQLGLMPMKELIQPAMELARDGVEVDPFQAYLLQLVAPIYSTKSALPLFSSPANRQRLIAPGDLSKNTELAEVMESLALEGEDLFYRGEIARAIVQVCGDKGHLTYKDLVEYETMVRDPLSTEYKGHYFYTNPPPSAGGILINFGLNLLKHIDLKRGGYGNYKHIRTLTEIMLKTSAARVEHFAEGPHHGLLDEDLLELYRREVYKTARAYRGTTHVSVIDGQRNIAAMTVSNGEGCGELVPGTGMMLNNMLGEEDLNPGGFHRWKTNQRMSSMMAPSILQDQNGGLTAFGSGGSNRIRTAILQVVSNITDFNLDLESAIVKPRIHIETDVFNVEAGLPSDTIDRLTREFTEHRIFDQANMFFGGVHAVHLDSGGGVTCMGDPRRNGVGVIVN
ncbi:MAG: gamma-glutamyltransferase [Arenicellales bacterium]|nr:gamma-glutamyltransferase [Arenicellales bacterium]